MRRIDENSVACFRGTFSEILPLSGFPLLSVSVSWPSGRVASSLALRIPSLHTAIQPTSPFKENKLEAVHFLPQRAAQRKALGGGLLISTVEVRNIATNRRSVWHESTRLRLKRNISNNKQSPNASAVAALGEGSGMRQRSATA